MIRLRKESRHAFGSSAHVVQRDSAIQNGCGKSRSTIDCLGLGESPNKRVRNQ